MNLIPGEINLPNKFIELHTLSLKMMINFNKLKLINKSKRSIKNKSLMGEKILLAAGIVIWVSIAIYILIDARKKVKLLGEKYRISYPFQCIECKHIKNYTYSQYMEIVKKPRNTFRTFTRVRSQYLFHCDECQKNNYQEIVSEQIPSNPAFERKRQKILIFFLLKEIVLGISVTAILGLSGIIAK